MLARLDNRLLYAMRTRFHSPGVESAMKWLGRLGNNGAIWLAIGLVLAVVDEGNRREWVRVALLGPVMIVINFAIKAVVRRQRPVLEGLPPLGGAPSSLSFPSAHASSAFACATAATRIAPEGALLFIPAALLAIGRPYLGMHYPSDVLGGIVLGIAIGLVVPL
jgi:membrane-associated phospholipid phosphatase